MSEVQPTIQLTWISAQAALALLRPIYVEATSAQVVMVNYLGAGLVRACCTRMTSKKALSAEPPGPDYDNIFIPAQFWEALSDSNRKGFEDWGTGSFAAKQWHVAGKAWWLYRVFGVTFCEEDILAIKARSGVSGVAEAWGTERAQAVQLVTQLRERIATFEQAAAVAALPAPAPHTAPAPETADAAPKKAVSEAALEAWWGLYQAVRLPHERNDDDMATHFDQCLPDKSVTRARLRTIRGKPKPGPKSATAE